MCNPEVTARLVPNAPRSEGVSKRNEPRVLGGFVTNAGRRAEQGRPGDARERAPEADLQYTRQGARFDGREGQSLEHGRVQAGFAGVEARRDRSPDLWTRSASK